MDGWQDVGCHHDRQAEGACAPAGVSMAYILLPVLCAAGVVMAGHTVALVSHSISIHRERRQVYPVSMLVH